MELSRRWAAPGKSRCVGGSGMSPTESASKMPIKTDGYHSMLCACGHGRTAVVEKRNKADYIRRRRQCLKCKRRFTTYESSIKP